MISAITDFFKGMVETVKAPIRGQGPELVAIKPSGRPYSKKKALKRKPAKSNKSCTGRKCAKKNCKTC